jgi:hypothetical protein
VATFLDHAAIRLVAVGIPAQVRRDEGVSISEAFDDRQKLAVFLRPAVHAQHNRTLAAVT